MTRNPLRIAGFATAMALSLTAAQAQSSSSSSTASPPATGAATTTSSAPAKTSEKASKADQHFITEAIQGDLAEVNVGKLAQQKGQADDVKQFGQTLEQDHGQNLQKAQALAQQMGVTAPTEPSAKQKAVYDKLDKATGAASTASSSRR